MALDEALLDWHSRGEIGPVLRFYEWNPATLSIGYFQSVEKEIDMEQLKNMDLDLLEDLPVEEVYYMNMNLHIA